MTNRTRDIHDYSQEHKPRENMKTAKINQGSKLAPSRHPEDGNFRSGMVTIVPSRFGGPLSFCEFLKFVNRTTQSRDIDKNVDRVLVEWSPNRQYGTDFIV